MIPEKALKDINNMVLRLVCEKCLKEVSTLYPLYDEANDKLPPKMVCLECLVTPPDLSNIFRISVADDFDS